MNVCASLGSKVRPRTFGCVAMAGSGVNRVQVVLSGFSKRLFCFVQASFAHIECYSDCSRRGGGSFGRTLLLPCYLVCVVPSL